MPDDRPDWLKVQLTPNSDLVINPETGLEEHDPYWKIRERWDPESRWGESAEEYFERWNPNVRVGNERVGQADRWISRRDDERFTAPAEDWLKDRIAETPWTHDIDAPLPWAFMPEGKQWFTGDDTYREPTIGAYDPSLLDRVELPFKNAIQKVYDINSPAYRGFIPQTRRDSGYETLFSAALPPLGYAGKKVWSKASDFWKNLFKEGPSIASLNEGSVVGREAGEKVSRRGAGQKVSLGEQARFEQEAEALTGKQTPLPTQKVAIDAEGRVLLDEDIAARIQEEEIFLADPPENYGHIDIEERQNYLDFLRRKQAARNKRIAGYREIPNVSGDNQGVIVRNSKGETRVVDVAGGDSELDWGRNDGENVSELLAQQGDEPIGTYSTGSIADEFKSKHDELLDQHYEKQYALEMAEEQKWNDPQWRDELDRLEENFPLESQEANRRAGRLAGRAAEVAPSEGSGLLGSLQSWIKRMGRNIQDEVVEEARREGKLDELLRDTVGGDDDTPIGQAINTVLDRYGVRRKN